MSAIKPKIITILGAGPLGLAYAEMCAHYGYIVFILEKERDIFLRNPAKIWHNDGIEYFNADSSLTGWGCVGGGVANAMYYPRTIETLVSHRKNRTHFNLSKESASEEAANRVSIPAFLANVEKMRWKYALWFQYIKQTFDLDDEQTSWYLRGMPDDFIVQVNPENVRADNVVTTVAGSAMGIDMDNFRRIWYHRLEKNKDKITLINNADVRSITKRPDGRRNVNFADVMGVLKAVPSDFVTITAGYETPLLVYRTEGAINGPEGHYMLNAMARFDHPGLIRRKQHSINFTVKGPVAGASYVYVGGGIGYGYDPNLLGTQFEEYNWNLSDGLPPPDHFEKFIKGRKIHVDADIRKNRIVDKEKHYYPFLKDNLLPERVSFDYNVVYTPHGKGERRSQREVVPSTDVTGDGKVRAAHSSKLTTHLPHALQMLQETLRQDRGIELPTIKGDGFEGDEIDMIKALGPREPGGPNLILDPEMVIESSKSHQQSADACDFIEFGHAGKHSVRRSTGRRQR